MSENDKIVVHTYFVTKTFALAHTVNYTQPYTNQFLAMLQCLQAKNSSRTDVLHCAHPQPKVSQENMFSFVETLVGRTFTITGTWLCRAGGSPHLHRHNTHRLNEILYWRYSRFPMRPTNAKVKMMDAYWYSTETRRCVT